MKPIHQLCMLAAIAASGLATMVAKHHTAITTAEAIPRSLTTGPNNAGRSQPVTPNRSDDSAPPVQLSTLQVLDQSVMAVMNNKAMSNEKKFEFFWDGYQKNKSSIALSSYYIDCLSSIVPLPHIDQLLAELDNTMTAAEIKNHLMQVLQSSYLQENGLTGTDRQFALNGIKASIANADPAVAGQAVLLYARMGAQDDLVRILADALQQKIISPADYIRESVFQLPNVDTPEQQHALLATLISDAQKNDTNQLEHQLMTSLELIIQSPSRLARIDPTSRTAITHYLMTHEPAVQSDGINYDLVSAIEYGDWLRSYGIIKSKSDADMLDWVTRQMTDIASDTKKIVAVMNSPMAPDLVQMASQIGQLEGMKQRVERDLAGKQPGSAAYAAYEAALGILRQETLSSSREKLR